MRSRFDPSDSTAIAAISWEIKKRNFSLARHGLEPMKIKENICQRFPGYFSSR